LGLACPLIGLEDFNHSLGGGRLTVVILTGATRSERLGIYSGGSGGKK
jgi:hypothetical protein